MNHTLHYHLLNGLSVKENKRLKELCDSLIRDTSFEGAQGYEITLNVSLVTINAYLQ